MPKRNYLRCDRLIASSGSSCHLSSLPFGGIPFPRSFFFSIRPYMYIALLNRKDRSHRKLYHCYYIGINLNYQFRCFPLDVLFETISLFSVEIKKVSLLSVHRSQKCRERAGTLAHTVHKSDTYNSIVNLIDLHYFEVSVSTRPSFFIGFIVWLELSLSLFISTMYVVKEIFFGLAGTVISNKCC